MRNLVVVWLLVALCAWSHSGAACDVSFLLLSEPFRAAVHDGFSAYAPRLPAPRRGPPFTGVSQRLYHFLLHGQLLGKPLAKSSLATRAAVTKIIMDEIAAEYPQFRNYGPTDHGGAKIFHGRFGSFIVLYPDGSTYFGTRNPVNGRPVRGQEYEPAQMAEFFTRHDKVIEARGKVPNEIELSPLEEYLRGSIENYAQTGG